MDAARCSVTPTLFFSSTRPYPVEVAPHDNRQVAMLRGAIRMFPYFGLLRLGMALSGVAVPLGAGLCMLGSTETPGTGVTVPLAPGIWMLGMTETPDGWTLGCGAGGCTVSAWSAVWVSLHCSAAWVRAAVCGSSDSSCMVFMVLCRPQKSCSELLMPMHQLKCAAGFLTQAGPLNPHWSFWLTSMAAMAALA